MSNNLFRNIVGSLLLIATVAIFAFVLVEMV